MISHQASLASLHPLSSISLCFTHAIALLIKIYVVFIVASKVSKLISNAAFNPSDISFKPDSLFKTILIKYLPFLISVPESSAIEGYSFCLFIACLITASEVAISLSFFTT